MFGTTKNELSEINGQISREPANRLSEIEQLKQEGNVLKSQTDKNLKVINKIVEFLED